jgi:hypothetical protein
MRTFPALKLEFLVDKRRERDTRLVTLVRASKVLKFFFLESGTFINQCITLD